MKAYTVYPNHKYKGSISCKNIFFFEEPPFSIYSRNSFEMGNAALTEENAHFTKTNDKKFTYITEVGVKRTRVCDNKEFHAPCAMFTNEPRNTFMICPLDERNQVQGALIRFQLPYDEYKHNELEEKIKKILPIFSSISVFENVYSPGKMCVTGISEMGIRMAMAELKKADIGII